MKYITAVLALATAASAQDLSLFPPCSLPCITDAVGKATTCATTDFACVCSNMDAVKSAATSCVIAQCGADVALNQVLPATEKFCSQVGGGGGSAASSSSQGTTPTSSTPPAGSPSSSSPQASSTTAVPSPTSTGIPDDDDGDDDDSSSSSSHGSSFATPLPTGAGSSFPPSPTASSSRPTSSVQTGGAPAVGVMGSLGMLVLGAVAAL